MPLLFANTKDRFSRVEGHMTRSLLFSSQFSCVINTVGSEVALRNVQVLVRWLHQMPSDLGIHCFIKRIYWDSAE